MKQRYERRLDSVGQPYIVSVPESGPSLATPEREEMLRLIERYIRRGEVEVDPDGTRTLLAKCWNRIKIDSEIIQYLELWEKE